MAPFLTIGMPAWDNPDEVWFTTQALRMYHQDKSDTEIVVVDNKGCKKTEEMVKSWREHDEDETIRYELYNKINGTGPPRNKVFELARGEFVLVIDSHVLIWPGAIERLKWWLRNNWEDARNLIQGPIVLGALVRSNTHYKDEWRSQMWGIWGDTVDLPKLPEKPFEIEMMGLGLFGCRKDSWLGFAPGIKGFDGVEGVLHHKYRKAGRKVLCLPFLKWVHYFGAKHTYPLRIEDKVRNFLIGFKEIDMDPKPIYDHFGASLVAKIAERLQQES